MSWSLYTRFLLWLFLLAILRPAQSAAPKFLWERMSVVRVAPSQVFTRLGLTHNTRHGYTRDGFKKTDPDPTFPEGLTDVVPYDVSHILLVRGTPQGLAEFRARVIAAEDEIVNSGKWRVTVDLLPAQAGGVPGTATPIGAAKVQDVITDIPFDVTVGDPAQPQNYQLSLHLQPDGAISVTCQSGLLPTPAVTAQAVWTPPQVWTAPISRFVPAGGTVLFDDLMTVKQTARQKLGLPQDPIGADFQVRVSVLALTQSPTLPALITPASAAPVPPVSVVTPAETTPPP